MKERAEDMTKFWEGFVKWRREEHQLEAELLDYGQEVAVVDGKPLTDLEKLELTEALMLMRYGAQLVCELKSGLMEKPPIPKIEMFETGGMFGQYKEYWDRTGKLEKTFFWVNYRELLKDFNLGTSGQMGAWGEELTMTVSQNFRDVAVVMGVLAGVEEYAHELRVRAREGKKMLADVANYDDVKPVCDRLLSTDDFDQAELIYHTTEVERRGLVWQEAIIRRYFPHWLEPTQKLVEKVRQKRLSKLI